MLGGGKFWLKVSKNIIGLVYGGNLINVGVILLME